MTQHKPVTIIYHADCIDGFGAAYAAWCKFGALANYQPISHGQPWEMAKIADHDVFILDFSFPPPALRVMADRAHSVTQIDHHVSARQLWADRLQDGDDGNATYRDPSLPLHVIFNLEKSGARLAWEYFQPKQRTPLVLRHIEDQDLWRFALPGSRNFCRALRLQAFDFDIWHDLVAQTPSPEAARYREMLEHGAAIESYFKKETEEFAHSHLRMSADLRGEPIDALQALRHGQTIIVEGDSAWLAVRGIAVNANALFTSELGHLLAEQSNTFGLIWQLSGDGEIKASLRSQGDFDVAAIAARYGGGGHRNAAGFRMAPRQFMTEVLGMK
ncbi:MAG: phosphoesterase [Betaproteobacteria bacterium HGW-Betaproteobacteria-10]|nr:MAG: phosphoesterase [Betaproteobacteria bacterium HGW-Betaproteobacteria-10]